MSHPLQAVSFSKRRPTWKMAKVVPDDGGKGGKPPTRKEMAKKAMALAEQDRFGNSKTSVCSTSIKDLGKLGVGIQLYFMFMKYLGVLFALMTLISFPAMVLHRTGHGVSEARADPLGLAYFSIGNEGLHPDNNNTEMCQPVGTIDCTLRTLNNPITPDPEKASLLITLCDIASSIVFILFLNYFRLAIKKAVRENDEQNITPGDYAVFVRGLPSNATEEEILQHFNDLYDLSKPKHTYPMWFGCFGPRKVPKMQYSVDASPVTNLDHVNGNEMYRSKWIAQVSIGYRTNGLLRKFLSMEKLSAKIAKYEEIVAMYESGSYKEAGALRRKAAAQKKLDNLKNKWAKKTAHLSQLKNGAPVNTECECAYVVFNNSESRGRCLDDYRTSKGSWARLFQPKSLRFRRKFALNVQEAPEPSNIIWQNLEVSQKSRRRRRMITFLITFLLLLISFGLIYVAQTQQKAFASKLPSPDICDTIIPATYEGSHNLEKSKYTLQWKRDLDYKCPPGKFYIDFKEYLRVRTYPKDDNYEICTDPCTFAHDNRKCGSLSCHKSHLESENNPCITYPASAKLYCVCKPALTASIRKYGIVAGPRKLWKEAIPCRGYLKDFILKNGMMLLAAISVVLINIALKGILRALAKFERHHSESSMATAVTIKLFFATFLNTAMIALIVNAKLPVGDQGFLSNFSWLFQGEYEDFLPEWYTAVGVSITMTMIINVIVPQLGPLAKTYVIFPVKRWFKSHSAVTQDQMNALYEGPSFDISIRFPLVLNTLFVTMCYCGGVPILLPIASIACFANYYFDKLTIIRLYSVRTTYDEALGKLAQSLMKWALIFHLAFSMWMYGNPALQSPLINTKWFSREIGVSDNARADVVYTQLRRHARKYDPFGEYGLIPKIVRLNVFPIFLFLVFVLVFLLLKRIAGNVIYPLLDKTIGKILRCFVGAAKSIKSLRVKPLKASPYAQLPPYSGEFRQFVGMNYRLNPTDETAGWRLENGNLYRIWTKDTEKHGLKRVAGDRRLTWESFRATVKTFAIEQNDKYKNAAARIQEIQQSRTQ